jgi:signal transduction histidine kinase
MMQSGRRSPDRPYSGAVVEAAALHAVSDALLGIAGDLRTDAVLDRLVAAARELSGAQYAALGVPDDAGTGFSRWLTSGLTDAEIDAIGPLPRTHGVLGAALADPAPFRSDEVRADERFAGWWPAAHPDMVAFLAVPIVFQGDVVGAFYLANKAGGFDEHDERQVVELAAHAAVLIEHARLFEAGRELSVLEERNRLARELHDALTQSLFGLRLRLETAREIVADDPERATTELDDARGLLDSIFDELRSLVIQLRPPALEAEGLVATLRKHVEMTGRLHGIAVSFDANGVGPLDADREAALFRIGQEALTNVVRHADASRAEIRLRQEAGYTTLTITDNGVGFDPASRSARSRRLGLASMRERAAAEGGTLVVESVPGQGTTVRAEVPVEE